MKKVMFLFLLGIVLLSSCAESKTIDGKVYKPYGLFNEDTYKNDSIVYELSPGSVICSIIFIETVFVPVYTVGWDLYEPVRKK